MNEKQTTKIRQKCGELVCKSYGGKHFLSQILVRRNSFMLMPLTRKTLLPISKGALLTESSSSRLSSSSKSARKNKNVLMMIYLPAYYNCSRSRLFSSLFFVFVQEFIDPCRSVFAFYIAAETQKVLMTTQFPSFVCGS